MSLTNVYVRNLDIVRIPKAKEQCRTAPWGGHEDFVQEIGADVLATMVVAAVGDPGPVTHLVLLAGLGAGAETLSPTRTVFLHFSAQLAGESQTHRRGSRCVPL